MKHVLLPDDRCRRLPFYLALEEWVARTLPAEDWFFSWSVAPTVIVGRNQDLATEVDLEYCRTHGIDVCRRRSGGGCVYADPGNIMLSFVTDSTDVHDTFARCIGLVADRLRAMGIDARANGRNDIEVNGRKVSGNAFYHLPGRSIVHGTMLYDTDMANMLGAITPTRAKLQSHRVTSVEARVVTVRQLLPEMEREQFRRALVDGLTDSEYMLTDSDIRAVETIEGGYYRPGWLENGR